MLAMHLDFAEAKGSTFFHVLAVRVPRKRKALED
jgi:hypothetical protein